MTWDETSPGVHEATGRVLYARIDQIDPFDPYRWRVWCKAGAFEAVEEMQGTIAQVQVKALKIVGEFAVDLAKDAKAGIRSAKQTPVAAGVSYR